MFYLKFPQILTTIYTKFHEILILCEKLKEIKFWIKFLNFFQSFLFFFSFTSKFKQILMKDVRKIVRFLQCFSCGQCCFNTLMCVMPAVHSRRMYLARVSGESCQRRDQASATLHSCRELSILARDTRRLSANTRDPLTRTSWTAKKARHEHRDYTRGFKARRVFPSTFLSLGSLGESVQPA